MHRFHIFQIATVLALWGVVISAVYMLRAYRSASWARSRNAGASLTDLRAKLAAADRASRCRAALDRILTRSLSCES